MQCISGICSEFVVRYTALCVSMSAGDCSRSLSLSLAGAFVICWPIRHTQMRLYFGVAYYVLGVWMKCGWRRVCVCMLSYHGFYNSYNTSKQFKSICLWAECISCNCSYTLSVFVSNREYNKRERIDFSAIESCASNAFFWTCTVVSMYAVGVCVCVCNSSANVAHAHDTVCLFGLSVGLLAQYSRIWFCMCSGCGPSFGIAYCNCFVFGQ